MGRLAITGGLVAGGFVVLTLGSLGRLTIAGGTITGGSGDGGFVAWTIGCSRLGGAVTTALGCRSFGRSPPIKRQ
ncbi:MAG: hypothetical protein N2C14_04650 [Planctomycetales bacterium]